MIWVVTFVYFLLNLPIIWVGFELYARILKIIGTARSFVKHFCTLTVYLLFAAFIITPILVALRYFPEWNIEFRENKVYMAFFLCCYILSIIPGGYHFKKKHIRTLQKLGFF